MCIAILNTAGAIPEANIKNSWDNNNQGAGLLYSLNGELKTFKTYEYKEFLTEYKKVRSIKQVKNIVLHFRIATSGHEKYTNLHPFLVSPEIGFVHNGIIPGIGDQKYSDTYYFNEMLKTFKHDFLQCDATKILIQNYIDWSKLIFLDKDNNVTIIGEEKGMWDGCDWYSNDSYKSYNDYEYFGNVKVSKSQPKHKQKGKAGKNEVFNSEYFKFYTNATDENLFMLCDYLGVDPHTEQVEMEIEGLAYHYNSYDLVEIINRINDEFNEEETEQYNNVNFNQYQNQNRWESY